MIPRNAYQGKARNARGNVDVSVEVYTALFYLATVGLYTALVVASLGGHCR